MKIGMNMLLWTNHVTEQHYGIVDSLKQTGYDGIELFLGEGNEQHYSSLGNHFTEIEMGVTCVASLAAEENIASPDQKTRNAGLEKLKWSIDMGVSPEFRGYLWSIPFQFCLLYTSAPEGRRKAMEY